MSAPRPGIDEDAPPERDDTPLGGEATPLQDDAEPDLATRLESAGIQVVRDEADLAPRPDDPPVVARLMVEIRSDGSRTIARGALEERTLGQRVALQAEAGTPQELTALLLKQLVSTPALTGKAVKDLLAAKARGLRQRLTRKLLPGPRDARGPQDT